MPKRPPFDLRARVLAAVDAGLSCRQAAERFGLSPSSAIRWQALRRAGGDSRPKPQGGDRLSHRTEAHAGLLPAALAQVPDITLPELKARLAGQGASVSVAALWRYFRRHKITRKNVWPTPSARVISGWRAGLHQRIRSQGALALAKMDRAHRGPHRVRSVEHHIFGQALATRD